MTKGMTLKRTLSIFLALIMIIAAFAVLRPVNASAASMINYTISYTEKYVKLKLTVQSSENTIYYTTNGTVPTTASKKYTGTLKAKSKVTVTAIEFNKSGKSVASLKTTLKPRVVKPVFSLSGSWELSIVTKTEGAKIYYTTDGTTPTQKSKLYTGAFEYTPGTTIIARAYKNDMKSSAAVRFVEKKSDAPSGDKGKVFELMNKERVKAGLPEFVYDSNLDKAADIRAKELAQKFSHTRPDGTSCETVFGDIGMTYWNMGENIAYGTTGYFGPDEIMDGWMKSTGHRENILEEGFGRCAVGIYTSGGVTYWVQLFKD